MKHRPRLGIYSIYIYIVRRRTHIDQPKSIRNMRKKMYRSMMKIHSAYM